MAITASGLYVKTFLDVFDATQEAVNLVGDTIKTALYTNSQTPSFSADTSYSASPYTSNEISGAGYTPGGSALASKTFTESPTGSVMFDAADLSWASATFTLARGALIYDDTLAASVAKPVVCFINFGSDFGVTAGTFTIQWATTGIFAIDLTP